MEYSEESKNLSVSLSFFLNDLKKVEGKMLTIEKLNYLHNNHHYISPMTVDLEKFINNYYTPCKLLNDVTVACVFHFMTYGKEDESNGYSYAYFRISQTKFDDIMWYTYVFCGPEFLNTVLTYKAVVIMWIIKYLAILILLRFSDAWFTSYQFVIFALLFVFILYCI